MNKKFTFITLTVCFLLLGLVFVGINGNTSYAQEQFEMMHFENAVTIPDGLNVRSGPSLRYPVVTVLVKGESINILGRVGNWYLIYEPLNAYGGFVYGEYLNMGNGQEMQDNTPEVVIPPVNTPAPSETQTPKETVSVTSDEQKLLDLVNNARTQAGLKSLSFNAELRKCAIAKAQDMVKNNYFAHESPTYGSPFDMMRQFGISFRSAGENIAGNQSVEGAFNAWMNSTGHRENILNKNFDYVGFGIVDSPVYGKILVQQFIGV